MYAQIKCLKRYYNCLILIFTLPTNLWNKLSKCLIHKQKTKKKKLSLIIFYYMKSFLGMLHAFRFNQIMVNRTYQTKGATKPGCLGIEFKLIYPSHCTLSERTKSSNGIWSCTLLSYKYGFGFNSTNVLLQFCLHLLISKPALLSVTWILVR